MNKLGISEQRRLKMKNEEQWTMAVGRNIGLNVGSNGGHLDLEMQRKQATMPIEVGQRVIWWGLGECHHGTVQAIRPADQFWATRYTLLADQGFVVVKHRSGFYPEVDDGQG